jgi:hypothetical protein
MREHESHRCMREHERHRECDKIRCSEAIDVGNNEIHHCLSLGARSVDRRRRDFVEASRCLKVTRRDSNVINNGRIVASTRNMTTTTSRPLWRNSSNKVKATDTRRRLAHTRRSQIARINTALSNYFSVLRAIHLHSTQKLSFQSWLNEKRAIAESDAKHLLWNLISSA